METKPPLPPFTLETAKAKVQAAEDGWNSRNPEKVALAYTVDSQWRNRAEFINGRAEVIAFLKRKWAKELDYRLKKDSGALWMIGSPFVLNMSGMMMEVFGIVPMAMKTGSLLKMV